MDHVEETLHSEELIQALREADARIAQAYSIPQIT